VSEAEWEMGFFLSGFVLSTLAGTHQLLGNADTLGVSVQTIKRNTETLVVASKEIGLEGNAEKIKFMVMSWDQKAGKITT
jgi:hypothetical protein